MVNLLLLPTTGSGGYVTDLEQTSLDRKLTTHASTQTTYPRHFHHKRTEENDLHRRSETGQSEPTYAT